MNATEQNADLHAAQECESLAGCVARGQKPASYADIVAKLRGHADKLPTERRVFWTEQCKALGVILYEPPAPPPPPPPPPMRQIVEGVRVVEPQKAAKSSKPEASSTL